MFTKKWKGMLIAVCTFALSASATAGGLLVGADAEGEGTVVAPIAKYEFLDASDPGKDSMGNYHLTLRDADGKSNGTVTAADGVATFNGTAGLRPESNASDVSESLTSFTLTYEVKTDKKNSGWASPVSFGWNDWTATKWATFQFSGASDMLRYSAAGKLIDGGEVDSGGKPIMVSDIDGHTSAFWGYEIGAVSDDYHKITLTAEVGGKMTVYYDATVKYSHDLPADFDLKDATMRFSLGGECAWGNIYQAFSGNLKNVSIYDFSMTAAEVASYWADGQLTSTELTKATAAGKDLSSSVIVAEGASNDEILKTAPAYTIVPATMNDESSRFAFAYWDNVVTKEDGIYLEGTLKGIYNPDNVKAYAKIGVTAATEITPLARYEFKDAANPGKDSMGNFDLVVRDADGKKNGTVAVNNGVATFNGTAGLIPENNASDISENLTSFTLFFEVQMENKPSGWVSPISFGWNDWTATKWATFQFSGGSDLLRFSSAGSVVDKGAGPVSDIDGHDNAFWGVEIGNVGTAYHKVALTVQQGGKMIVYLDGAASKYSYDVPETFNLKDGNMRFSIGGESVWGNLYQAFTGNIKNVSFYDFSMTAAQVKTLGDTQKIKTNSLVNQTWLESVDASTMAFTEDKVLTAPLYDKMTQAQMLACMGSASVKGTMSDESKTDVPVVWTKIEKAADGDVWTAYGHVQDIGLGIPSVLTDRTNVTQTVEMLPAFSVTVASGIENGRVKVSKGYGVTGDVIEITLTPSSHFETDAVTVNDTAISAGADGKYSVTLADGDVEINATFKAVEYTVSVGEGVENGTLTFSAGKGTYDTVIEVTATPNAHYVLSKVFVNGEEITRNEGKYTFKITGNMTVTATFTEAVYSVDCFVTGSHGTASADKASAKAGETVVVTTTPEEGYKAEVKVNGTAIEAKDGVYSFVVDGDAEIEVKFTEITHAITCSTEGGHGSVSADKTAAKAGETVTLTLSPEDGYEVDTVKVNGTAITAKDGVYSFVVSGDTEVKATFKAGAVTPPESSSSSSEKDSSTQDGSSSGTSGSSQVSSGCGSTVGISAGLALLGAAAALLLKKRKND